MARLLAIDLGRKRCGLAVTDSEQIVANGLATVATNELEEYLKAYLARENVEKIIVGKPVDMRGQPSDCTRFIDPVLNRLRKVFPLMVFESVDERFTSALAHQAMIDGGMRKSQRREKGNADLIAATIILNDYLESRIYKEQT